MSIEKSKRSVVGYALMHPFSCGSMPLHYAIAKWFGKKIVIITDFDGEENHRIVRYCRDGTPFVYRMDFSIHPVVLQEDGNVKMLGGANSFVKRWREV